MYLVACKWLASGAVSYKKPLDYFLYLADKDSAEPINQAILEYARNFEAIANSVISNEHQNILIYYWLEDDNDLNKITMTYYADKNQFDQWNASATHTAFLENRNNLLNATGIMLQVVEKEVSGIEDSIDYNTANQLFSN
jgi:DNA polymerase III gamma/tau subunit